MAYFYLEGKNVGSTLVSRDDIVVLAYGAYLGGGITTALAQTGGGLIIDINGLMGGSIFDKIEEGFSPNDITIGSAGKVTAFLTPAIDLVGKGNSVINYGYISAKKSNSTISFVKQKDEGSTAQDYVLNYGHITSTGNSASNSGTISSTAVGGLKVHNYGTVAAIGQAYAISTTNGLVNIENDGSIIGGVNLNGSSIYFDTSGGTIKGNIIVSASSFNTVKGSNLADTITASGPFNTIHGNGGDDSITASGVYNYLSGGSGNDTYYIKSGASIYEDLNEGTDTVYAEGGYTLADNVERLILVGNGNFAGTGNALANSIDGNSGNNVINGGAGIDTMRGAAGNDTYIIDHSNDAVFELINFGSDTILTSVDYRLAAGVSVENVFAQAPSQTKHLKLEGNEFANTIKGNAGANVLNGKLGADILVGLGGSDTFLFDSALSSKNVDRIQDFSKGDRISIEGDIFRNLKNGALTVDAFKDVAKGIIDASDRVIYDSKNGKLYYDADGSGVVNSVQFAAFDNKFSLSAGDIFVV